MSLLGAKTRGYHIVSPHTCLAYVHVAKIRRITANCRPHRFTALHSFAQPLNLSWAILLPIGVGFQETTFTESNVVAPK